jgi:hypothetical protein
VIGIKGYSARTLPVKLTHNRNLKAKNVGWEKEHDRDLVSITLQYPTRSLIPKESSVRQAGQGNQGPLSSIVSRTII